jgi:hypothetical protein
LDPAQIYPYLAPCAALVLHLRTEEDKGANLPSSYSRD